MKRILFATNSLGCGGVPKAACLFLKALNYEEYDVTMLLLHEEDFFLKELPPNIKIKYIKFNNSMDRGVITTNMNYLCENKHILSRIKRKFLNLKNKEKINGRYETFKAIAKKTQKENQTYDIAIDFYGYGSFLTMYVAECVNARKKLTWLHGEDFLSWIKNVEPVIHKFDKIMCVSNVVKNKFDQSFSQYSNRSEVFYNIIDNSEIIANAKIFDAGFDKSLCNFVTVGRLSKEKNYGFAIEVARELKKKIQFKWYFVGEGSERKQIEKLIKDYNLEEEVILLGRKENPYPYIEAATIYVQPSLHEGMGLTMLEACVLKKVIVASNIPSFQELAKHGHSMVLLDLSVENFTKAITTLCTEKDKYDNLVKQILCENVDYSNEIIKLEYI